MHKTLVLISFISLLVSCSSTNDDTYSSEKELKENYIQKQSAINSLKRYYNSITPKDFEVYIEFSSPKLITLQIYYITTPKYPRKVLFEQWDINPFNYKIPENTPDMTKLGAQTNSFDEVKRKLNWNDETFVTIKKFLDSANCISITNGEPAKIGFRRSGLGMYFYDLFDQPLNDSLKKVYNDSCTYRIFNNSLALEYNDGAVGPQCFPD